MDINIVHEKYENNEELSSEEESFLLERFYILYVDGKKSAEEMRELAQRVRNVEELTDEEIRVIFESYEDLIADKIEQGADFHEKEAFKYRAKFNKLEAKIK